MTDQPLAPMTDWRDRVWAKYDLVVSDTYREKLLATPHVDETPCFKVPCPPFSPPERDEVTFPDVMDQLQVAVADYREKMLSDHHDDGVVVYLPQWIMDKMTDRERQLLSDWNMTVRTHW